MKRFIAVGLLFSSSTAFAASPEDTYLATRDRDIAALTKIENAKDSTAGDAQFDADTKDLEQKLRAAVGPSQVPGFPTQCKLNLDTLFPHDEGFGMLDGIACGDGDSNKTIIVTTDSLLNKWLVGHRNWWSDDSLPTSPIDAVKTEAFYTQAISTDAAVVHYGVLPVKAPPDSKFAYSTLSARTQDQSPNAPDQIFVVLEHKGRIFIANAKLNTPFKPIVACDAVTADYAKRAAAAEKAYVNSGLKDQKLTDAAVKIRNDGDIAFRSCFAQKAKELPGFKAAEDQSTGIVAAIAASK